MNQLSMTLKLARDLSKLDRRSRYQWAEFNAARGRDDISEAHTAWIALTRTQHDIATLLGAINVVTENAYNNHVYHAVDKRESGTGWYEGLKCMKKCAQPLACSGLDKCIYPTNGS